MSTSSSNPNLPSVKFPDIFEAALKEYTKKTEKDIKSDLLFTKLQDCTSSDAVLKVLEEQALAFKQYRKGNWKVQLLGRLKPIVEILYRLFTNDGVKEGIVSIFPPAKAIFTGIGLLLEAAKGVSDNYDALIELFEHFERYLRRLQVSTMIDIALGEILVEIMVELLGVLALTTQQIKQGRLKKFAKKLFLGENDVEKVLQRLDRLTKEELQMTATQTLEVVNGLFKDMKTVVNGEKASMDNIQEALVTMQEMISDDLNNISRDQTREKIQKWLSPPDPSTNHNKACEVHQKVTPGWFLRGSIYDEWKTKGSLLWTHGKPGSGKSILCSSIIEDIKPKCATGLDSFAYYYFDFNDIGKQDRRGLLSSLLIQLCTRSHRGYDILLNLFRANANGLGQPSEVDMIQCLKKVLELLRYGRVYIIVDAVDESPNAGMPSPRENVLRLIEELVDLRHPNMRFCITSRPEVDIRTVLKPLPYLEVSLDDREDHKEDIVKYIESVVESDPNMQRWTPKDRQLVIHSLSQNAKGMFRWAYCQLDRLRRCLSKDIRKTLDELPDTLDETYERILRGIDKEKSEHAIRLLQCLAFSRRPLRVNELAEVLATRFDAGQIPSLHKAERPIKPDEDVLLAGSTLITTIKPGVHDDDNSDTRVVQFSHYSVVEFLTSERLANSKIEDLSQYYISPEFAHTTLAQSCIGTLLQLDNHVTHDFHLAEYAAQNWFHHAQYEGVAPHIEDGMNCLFDPNRNHFTAWVSVHNIDHVSSHSRLSKPSNPREPSPLYYATLCGFRSVVEYLVITCGRDPTKGHGRRGTPLQAAVVLGHTAIVQFFLDKAADVNVRDKHNSTPLHEASGSGNLAVMQLLLRGGANMNALDYWGDSPLHKAFRYQKFDAMKLLVKGGADVNVRGIFNSTPLHEASGSGNLDIVQLLLSLGADVNVFDHRGDSPLHKASRYQKLDAIKLLVDRGADVNARDKSNSTPLHKASGSGNLDVVKLLLSLDADVNVLNNWGDSPLHKASRYRKIEAIKLLVNRGADVNVRDKSNSTPLHGASGSGSLHVMKLLLSLGADVNALDYRGESALHKASRSQTVDAVILLVNGGANVNVRDKSNSTPLHEASGSKNLDIAQLLLTHGADVNVFDHWGDSPLHKLFRSLTFDIMGSPQGCYVEVNEDTYDRTVIRTTSSGENFNLVAPLSRKCTATMNARDKGPSTPVHDAPQGENYEMTQLLLAHGANVNVRGRWDKTPLDLASLEGLFDISRLLIEHGADFDAQTPFSIELARGHRKLTQLLLNYRILGTTIMAERYSYACVATVVAAAVVMVTTRMVNRFR